MAFIGSKISLISNSEVRYQGTLYTIDPQGSTIALQDVKCMGTENRKADKVIKASNTIYEFMIFNGENIKNLELIEEAPNELNDPAIIEAREAPSSKQAQDFYQQQRDWGGQFGQVGFYDMGGRPQSWGGGRGGRGGGLKRRSSNRLRYSGNNRKRGDGSYQNNEGRGGGISNIRNSGKVNNRRRRGSNSNQKADKKNRKKEVPGTGKFLERQSKDTDDADLEMTDKEFDFQGNLARFDMSIMKKALPEDNKEDDGDEKPKEPKKPNVDSEEKVEEKNDGKVKVEEEKDKEEQLPAYKHEDFFDTLSTDRETKRPTGNEMRDLDAETFGKIGSTYRCKTRWFRRWRGNFRGRGRGGFGAGYNQRKQN